MLHNPCSVCYGAGVFGFVCRFAPLCEAKKGILCEVVWVYGLRPYIGGCVKYM